MAQEDYYTKEEADQLLSLKQDTLIGSGENQNIKTVNGQELPGKGNISIGDYDFKFMGGDGSNYEVYMDSTFVNVLLIHHKHEFDGGNEWMEVGSLPEGVPAPRKSLVIPCSNPNQEDQGDVCYLGVFTNGKVYVGRFNRGSTQIYGNLLYPFAYE